MTAFALEYDSLLYGAIVVVEAEITAGEMRHVGQVNIIEDALPYQLRLASDGANLALADESKPVVHLNALLGWRGDDRHFAAHLIQDARLQQANRRADNRCGACVVPAGMDCPCLLVRLRMVWDYE